MSKTARLGIVAALLVVVGVTMALKQKGKDPPHAGDLPTAEAGSASRPAGTQPARDPAEKTALPRLVDLGAGKCVACKKMAPILEELRREFAGRLEVEFIDVWQNPAAADLYDVRMIPTQIFYDASGRELFRHEGFFGREDILGKWKELGYTLGPRPAGRGSQPSH